MAPRLTLERKFWTGCGPIKRAVYRKGLDPRTLYPRCDICGRVQQRDLGRQMGRWWVHQGCVNKSMALGSLTLPKLDYTIMDGETATAQMDRMHQRLLGQRQAFLRECLQGARGTARTLQTDGTSAQPRGMYARVGDAL